MQAGQRLCGQAFAAPGKAKALCRCRFDADTAHIKIQYLGNARPHGVAMRADLGPLANHRHIDMHDASTCLSCKCRGMSQKNIRRCAAPLRIAWRKMLADIACANRAEYGVGQRMQPGIGIGMADQALFMRHAHTAQHDVVARAEPMHIKAGTCSCFTHHAQQSLRPLNIFGAGDLDIVLAALNHHHVMARRLRHGHIIGMIGADGFFMRRQNVVKAETLRRLRPPERFTRHRLTCHCALDPADRVRDGHARRRANMRSQRVNNARNRRPINKGSRPVMDQHEIRLERGKRPQSGPNGILARFPARDRR